MVDASGDPEVLPDTHEECEAREDTVTDGDEVSDADVHHTIPMASPLPRTSRS